MKKLTTILFLVTFVLSVQAVPAKRGIWKKITLKDGKTIKAELVGDEYLHFWQTKDGNRYIQDGQYYKPADIVSLRKEAASLRGLDTQRPLRTPAQRKVRKDAAGYSSEYVGDKRSIIILVQFSDMSFSMDDPKSFYYRVANEEFFSEGLFKGSVADYFKDQSNGLFRLTFDVAGPYTLSNYASYGTNDANGNDSNARLMISSACQAAYNDGVDFTPYDWDGDGYVEEVYVLYAGRGEASGGDANTVWPHKSMLYPAPLTLGEVKVQTYACSNEMRSQTMLEGIGTICHEFSHCLGYPDMYDTDYATNGQYYGMGSWDLMSGGNHNDNGYCPAGYTAYEKWVAGWIKPEELDGDISVSGLKPVADDGKAYKMTNPGNANEYYIIENRQQTKWDAALPASGIVINHIDYDETVWEKNQPNTIGMYTDHERITMIVADNVRSSNTENGDAWPYGGNNTLNNGTTPADIVYNDNVDGTKYMNISISDMAINEDGEASFNFTDYNKKSSQEGFLLHETFDRCQGTGGNDELGFTPPPLSGSYASATFMADIDGWIATYMGGANKCARFGNTYANSGIVTSPEFTLDGRETTVSFKAAPWGTDGTDLILSVNGDATLGQENFTMVAGQWTEFTTTINGTGLVSLVFTPSHRFFLDEVYVLEPDASGIVTAVADDITDNMVRVYTSDGVLVYSAAADRFRTSDVPARGLLIIKGNGTVKKVFR